MYNHANISSHIFTRLSNFNEIESMLALEEISKTEPTIAIEGLC
jgi:hypothetical protein